VEAEVRAPGLVDHERHPAGVGDLGEAGDVGCHAVVGRRDDEGRAGAGTGVERLGEAGRGDAVGHPQLGVVLGRHETGPAAREHEPVDHRGVRVALHDDRGVQRGKGEAQRVVALRGAVGEKPRALGAVGLGREALRSLVGRRRGSEVDPLDVLWHVELQRVEPDGVQQPGVGAPAALVAGDVEARGAAEAVGDQGVEVRRAGLLAGAHLWFRP
jgi:hypothetical protein